MILQIYILTVLMDLNTEGKQVSVKTVGSAAPYLTISDKKTIIQSIEFKGDANSELADSFISLTAATSALELRAVRFTSITLASTPLISILSAAISSFDMSPLSYTTTPNGEPTETARCTFDTITRKEGSGTVFEVAVTGTTFAMHYADFKDCIGHVYESATAAAVYISLSSTPSSFSMSELSFSGCTYSTNSDPSKLPERNVYLQCPDGTFNTLANWTFISTYSETTKTKYIVHETTEARKAFTVSLLHFLFAPYASSLTDIYVAGTDGSKPQGVDFDRACCSLVFFYDVLAGRDLGVGRISKGKLGIMSIRGGYEK